MPFWAGRVAPASAVRPVGDAPRPLHLHLHAQPRPRTTAAAPAVAAMAARPCPPPAHDACAAYARAAGLCAPVTLRRLAARA